MSILYSISITLDAEYNNITIRNILEKGRAKGFIYYDNILDQYNDNPSTIQPEDAAHKLIQAQELSLELGPRILTILDQDGDNASIWFYKKDNYTIEVDISAFGCPRRKGMFLDFAYYIRMLLDLCEDFPVMELKTDMI